MRVGEIQTQAKGGLKSKRSTREQLNDSVRRADGARQQAVIYLSANSARCKAARDSSVNGMSRLGKPATTRRQFLKRGHFPTDTSYLIFPSMLQNIAPNLQPTLWQNVWVVPEQAIRGNVYLRSQPLWRFGRL